MERHGLSCMCLAHHELESIIIIITITILIIIIIVIIVFFPVFCSIPRAALVVSFVVTAQARLTARIACHGLGRQKQQRGDSLLFLESLSASSLAPESWWLCDMPV